MPGRYNTLFIPEHKLPLPRGAESPVALIAGSGAFAVSKASKLATLNPRYIMTIGNQMDLTAADYLEFLQDDPAVEIFAVYLEGFRPLDGAALPRDRAPRSWPAGARSSSTAPAAPAPAPPRPRATPPRSRATTR